MDNPTYSVLLSRNGHDLHAYVCGERTFASTIACWEDILAHVLSWSPRVLFLCDEMHGPDLSADEWHEIVQTKLRVALEGVRLAHVKPAGVASIEHCERFSCEAGLDARAFVDAGAAHAWLRSGNEVALVSSSLQSWLGSRSSP